MVGLSKNATLVARNIFPTNFLNGGFDKKMSCSHGSGVKNNLHVMQHRKYSCTASTVTILGKRVFLSNAIQKESMKISIYFRQDILMDMLYL